MISSFMFTVVLKIYSSQQQRSGTGRFMDLNIKISYANSACFHRVVSLSLDEKTILSDRIQRDSNFKGAIGQSLENILYDNQFKPEQSRFFFSKDVFLMMPVVIYSRKNFFLMKALNKDIEIMKSAGLIEFWKFKETKIKTTPTQPKVYSFQRLVACFEILAIGFIASFLVFIIELFIKRC